MTQKSKTLAEQLYKNCLKASRHELPIRDRKVSEFEMLMHPERYSKELAKIFKQKYSL